MKKFILNNFPRFGTFLTERIWTSRTNVKINKTRKQNKKKQKLESLSQTGGQKRRKECHAFSSFLGWGGPEKCPEEPTDACVAQFGRSFFFVFFFYRFDANEYLIIRAQLPSCGLQRTTEAVKWHAGSSTAREESRGVPLRSFLDFITS